MSRSLTRRSFAAGIAATGALGVVARGVAKTPDASADSESRVVSSANGDIELTGTPTRVVVLEYELVEHVQAAGVTPVGVTERDTVNEYVPLREMLGDDVVDVGMRDEPNLEAIITLEPDLIIAASPRQDATIERLQGIAPTVQVATYSPFAAPTGDLGALDHAKKVFRTVALALNQAEVAEAEIETFDAHLQATSGRVIELGYEGQPYVYGSINLPGDDSFEVNTDLSRTAAAISAIGLTNAISLDDYPGEHFSTLSMEQIGTLPDDILFFFSRSEAANANIDEALESDVLKSAGFVQNGGLVDLGEPFIWFAGGLITLTNVVDRVVAALEAR
ncbi:MAG TPA: ABC transporter substrate-binding protein [Thermomicrobiales bacterium]|nr:ABC transporter substrate-binding protein [Thermomicrobiales bacterium]